MKTKSKGARRERQVKKFLEGQGYLTTKSSGSFGDFDILALGRGMLLCIQVKSNRISKKERQKLSKLVLPKQVAVLKAIWIIEDYSKLPKVEILD